MLRPIARRLIAVDVVPFRVQLAREIGADAAVNPQAEGLATAVERLMPRGAETSFEVAGSRSTLEQAIEVAAPGGRIVLIGVQPVLHDFSLFRPYQDKGIRLLPLYRRGGHAGSSGRSPLPVQGGRPGHDRARPPQRRQAGHVGRAVDGRPHRDPAPAPRA